MIPFSGEGDPERYGNVSVSLYREHSSSHQGGRAMITFFREGVAYWYMVSYLPSGRGVLLF